MTLSNNASDGFIKLLGDNARCVIVTQVFPYEGSIKHAMIRELRDLAKARGMDDVTPAMLEGFAAAKVLVEGLRRAGPDPTRHGLRDAPERWTTTRWAESPSVTTPATTPDSTWPTSPSSTLMGNFFTRRQTRQSRR